MFGFFNKRPKPEPENLKPQQGSIKFPPVPDWKPEIAPPLSRVIERMRYYTNAKMDFAVFQHGTCVILPEGLADEAADGFAKEVLKKIFHYHADMNPRMMDDGNILVSYNHPAVNVVLSDFASEHWEEINRNHLRALATSEVLITPMGPNVFDDLGKKGLFGRCFMFMDAQEPSVVHIIRRAI